MVYQSHVLRHARKKLCDVKMSSLVRRSASAKIAAGFRHRRALIDEQT
jgi:hypothetical protein